MILEKIDQLLNEVSNLKASNAEEIEQLRLKYLSKKARLQPLWLTSATWLPTRKRLSE